MRVVRFKKNTLQCYVIARMTKRINPVRYARWQFGRAIWFHTDIIAATNGGEYNACGTTQGT